ncbi:UTRA domain-containing protein [uncultured Paracoccus sp.]|uniref:GntR family transcriptional regulator n=1 Tax=uncultured Paracoccus sp. TaxID=189685 RepID=UPI0025D0748D|nr:UTRA domain-containing protein [uncultured Paracoccus sp.]
MKPAARNWQSVKEGIDALIADGSFAPGAQLPSEPRLCQQFNTRRHSLRRAVEALEAEGKLIPRHGKGIFVAEAPMIDYIISRRTRFSANIHDKGHTAISELLDEYAVAPDAAAAQAMSLPPETPFLSYRSRGTVDGLPLLISRSWFEAARFPDLLERRRAHPRKTPLLASYGFDDYRRLHTRLHARPAREDEAGLLRLPPGGWVMVTRKVDADMQGRPIFYGESIWAAGRVRFKLDPIGEEE